MGTTSPDIKVTPGSNESPEVKPEKKAQNITEKNNEAAKKLKTAAPAPAPVPSPSPEEKPKWKFNTVGVTGGGDDKLSIVTAGPTLTSPDGETRITAGYTNSTERPDPNMNARNQDGIGVSVSTTPGAVVRGVQKLGNGIKSIFKKKK